MEDKKGYVEALSKLFSEWGLFDVVKLEYRKTAYDEIVDITYEGGYQKSVRVNYDGYPAILRDILRHVEE